MHFVLADDAAIEPQDLPPLQKGQCRIWVDYSESRGLIAHVAHATAEDRFECWQGTGT